jgi:diguanylate cyclase (GGDEF)-like protein
VSLGKRLWTAFGLIASLSIGLAIYGTVALSKMGDVIVRLYDEQLMGVNYARAAATSFSEARRLMDQSLALGSARPQDASKSLRQASIDIAEDLWIVRQRAHDVEVISVLGKAEKSISDWFTSEAMILEPPPGGITALPMPAVIQRQSAASTAWLDDLVEQVAANGFAYRSHAQREIRASIAVLTSLSGGIILIAGAFGLLFAHLMIRPIRAATRVAAAVASGNAADIAVTRRRDEIGGLLTSLATMQANLRSRDAQALDLLQDKDRTAKALGLINLRFDTALNNMPVGLLMCDGTLRIAVVNHRFCAIFGLDFDSIPPGSSYRDLLALSVSAGNYPGRTVDEILAALTPLFEARQRAAAVWTIAGARSIAVSYEPMSDGGWIATYEDIIERRKSDEQIVFLARHDALTKLPNRVLFQERLEQALAQAERGIGFALLWLDLDRFKAVNDVLGHPTGDCLLCMVAERLQELLRATDTVARLGGDEFAILQVGAAAAADAIVLARRILQVISQPYELDGHQVVIGASIGIALAPAGGSAHPVGLMRDADLALYRAKHDGRSTWRFFEPAMDAEAKARHQMEQDLRGALASGQLELHYQPMVCSQSRTVTGFEALLRWRHPTRGLVSPGEFISVAEEMGIITQIGAWVLQEAYLEAATWAEHLKVAVNLSTVQFRDQTLLGTVVDSLRTSGIKPRRLELEITESVPLQDDLATLSTLHALRALGIRIALDDFGTGYSSLSYLRSFPFDTIKIDQTFVRELENRDDCVAIVRAIAALCNTMNRSSTAEGVETEEQFAMLAAAGCTEIQGYLISRPVLPGALPALIGRLSEKNSWSLPALVGPPVTNH